jgi:hypothetical protein
VLSKYCRFVLDKYAFAERIGPGHIWIMGGDFWAVFLPDRECSRRELADRIGNGTDIDIFPYHPPQRPVGMNGLLSIGLGSVAEPTIQLWTKHYVKDRKNDSRSASLQNLIVRKINNRLFPQAIQKKCEWFLNHIEFCNDYFEYGAHKSAETDEIFVCSQEPLV